MVLVLSCNQWRCLTSDSNIHLLGPPGMLFAVHPNSLTSPHTAIISGSISGVVHAELAKEAVGSCKSPLNYYNAALIVVRAGRCTLYITGAEPQTVNFIAIQYPKANGLPCCRDGHIGIYILNLKKKITPSVGPQVSLVNLWHGRQPGGIVLNVNHLGMLRQLRESRLVPFRLGCNCLYDHPAFAHLFKR